MRNLALLAALIFGLSSGSIAGTKILWTSENGGTHQNGAVIGYDLETKKIEPVASLGGNFQGTHYALFEAAVLEDVFATGGMIKASDGYYYGVSQFGRPLLFSATGIIYRINPQNSEMELLHTFADNSVYQTNYIQGNYVSFGNELKKPILGLIEGETGVLYGIASEGGVHGEGGIWKYDINGSSYSKVADYDTLSNAVGRFPKSPLIKGPNDDLYGVLQRSGGYANGLYNDDGHLYKLNIADQKLEYISNLSTAGWAISGTVNQICYNSSLNKIFGTKELFAGGNYGGGVYSYDFISKDVTNESSILISEVDILGSNAYGMTPQASDGGHYFVTKNGGAHNSGTLVKYSPGTGNMAKVHDFMQTPNGTGIIIEGSKIYGSYFSLSPDEYMVWSYDVLSGVTNDILLGKDDNSVGYFIAPNFIVDGESLFAHTNWGGDGAAGSFIKYDIGGGQIEIIQNNVSVEGRGLRGELTLINDTIAYAFTPAGGTLKSGSENEYNEHGGIVEINLNSGAATYNDSLSKGFIWNHINYTSEWRFTKIENGNLYIPKMSYSFVGGIGFFTKKIDSKTGVEGTIDLPSSDNGFATLLEYSPNKLVMAYRDSIYTYDDTTGVLTSYATAYDTDANGILMNNLTLASNGKIYGLTFSAQRNTFDYSKKTSIIEIDTTTWQATVAYEFETGIYELNMGLTEHNGKLYGNTLAGGFHDQGYLFAYDIANKTLDNIQSFKADVDGGGFLGQWTVHDSLLYGVSFTGGAKGYGTFVSVNLNTNKFTKIKDLDLSNGRAYKATPVVWTYRDTIGSIIEEIPNSTVEYGINNSLQMNIWENTLYIKSANTKKVEFYNFAGQIVKISSNSSQVDFSDLESGAYMAKVYTSSKSQLIKVIRK